MILRFQLDGIVTRLLCFGFLFEKEAVAIFLVQQPPLIGEKIPTNLSGDRFLEVPLGLSSLELWVESVSQPVAEQIKCQNGYHDKDSGEYHKPWRSVNKLSAT